MSESDQRRAENERREATALRQLERARSLAARGRPRRRDDDVENDGLGEPSERDRTVSADEQAELGQELLEWAAELETNGRAREAYAFVTAVDGLPKWPDDDVELVLHLHTLAVRLEHHADAKRLHKRLAELGHSLSPPAGDPAGPTQEAAPSVRYAHPRFGSGVLVAREPSGLRIRFDDGERVVREDRLTRVL